MRHYNSDTEYQRNRELHRRKLGTDVSRRQYKLSMLSIMIEQAWEFLPNAYPQYRRECKEAGLFPVATRQAFARRAMRALVELEIFAEAMLALPDKGSLQ